MQCRSKTWCHNLPCAYSNVMFIISKYDEHMRGGGVYQCVILETYNGSLFMWAIRAKTCPRGLGDERAGASLDTTPASRAEILSTPVSGCRGCLVVLCFLFVNIFSPSSLGGHWDAGARESGGEERLERRNMRWKRHGETKGERGRGGEGGPESWAVYDGRKGQREREINSNKGKW